MTDSQGDPQQMNRRQLLRHTAWFGAAVGLSVVGGEVLSHVAGSSSGPASQPTLRFAQVSDSHIGFTGAANTDVAGSFTHAIDTINNLGYTPDFVIHTGDLTHLATPAQFDQVRQMMTGLRTPHVFTVPGEHDSADDGGAKYRQAFGAGTRGDGWYSFDIAGVHVIALVNTLNLKKLGHLGVGSARVRGEGSVAVAAERYADAWCSATSRCSRCTPTGAGGPTTPHRP
ncbi:metallophosphoesterase [Mycolicibacterium aubagnense]